MTEGRSQACDSRAPYSGHSFPTERGPQAFIPAERQSPEPRGITWLCSLLFVPHGAARAPPAPRRSSHSLSTERVAEACWHRGPGHGPPASAQQRPHLHAKNKDLLRDESTRTGDIYQLQLFEWLVIAAGGLSSHVTQSRKMGQI